MARTTMKLGSDLYSELCRGGFGDMGTIYFCGIFNEMKIYDNSLCKHSINVGNLSMKIADILGLNAKVAGYAGFLHDVGKLLLFYDEVAKKNGKEFESDDFEKIKDHTTMGYIELRRKGFQLASEVARDHHRLQGALSYPDITEEIGPYSKVVALADCYDAKISRQDRKGEDSSRNVRQTLEEERPGMEREIQKIYDRGIFTH